MEHIRTDVRGKAAIMTQVLSNTFSQKVGQVQGLSIIAWKWHIQSHVNCVIWLRISCHLSWLPLSQNSNYGCLGTDICVFGGVIEVASNNLQALEISQTFSGKGMWIQAKNRPCCITVPLRDALKSCNVGNPPTRHCSVCKTSHYTER